MLLLNSCEGCISMIDSIKSDNYGLSRSPNALFRIVGQPEKMNYDQREYEETCSIISSFYVLHMQTE